MEIGLLIGANCSKALEPEVLPSKDGGPFAFRTPLGWCVDGLFTKLERKVQSLAIKLLYKMQLQEK